MRNFRSTEKDQSRFLILPGAMVIALESANSLSSFCNTHCDRTIGIVVIPLSSGEIEKVELFEVMGSKLASK